MAENRWIDAEGCEHEDRESYVWVGVLGMCGCYTLSLVDLTMDILKKMYTAKKQGESYYYDHEHKTEAERSLQELILHILASKDLTEHGGSVRGSWLTDEGMKLAEKIFTEEMLNNG